MSNRYDKLDIEPIAMLPAADPGTLETIVSVWNAACGPDLATSLRLVTYNVELVPEVSKFGWFARTGADIKGFVLGSHARAISSRPDREMGWLDAIAVLPEAQGKGLGRRLIEQAERRLTAAGCRQARLGGGLRPFAPGLPTTIGSSSIFAHLGYVPQDKSIDTAESTWDVAADLADYRPPQGTAEAPCTVQPARPADQAQLQAFLEREFPDRWQFECEDYLRSGGRISDYMLLHTENGVEGFCRIAFEDSLQPLERFYPYRLRRPWGQLGPIGVGEAVRGRGFGAALMNAGLQRLHNNGINGCVIDWTNLLDFYARFSFRPYREYLLLVKSLM